MIQNSLKTINFCLFILVVLGVLSSLIFLFFQGDDPRIQQAEQSYYKGESAKSIGERKQSFNSSLSAFLDLEQDYNPQFGNGKLFYNIGNTYFQLEQYPLSILYFLKAQSLMPREDSIQNNLAVANEKLGLEAKSEVSAFSKILFIHYLFSLPERLQLLSLAIFLSLVLVSNYLWLKFSWFLKAAYLMLFLSLLLFLSVSYTRFLAPINAVIIKPTDLFLDAGSQYTRVGNKPLPAGSQVEIIGSKTNGKWFKVRTPNGDPGFIPQESFRVVEKYVSKKL